MDLELRKAYRKLMLATYNIVPSRGFQIHWDPERQGAVVWQTTSKGGRKALVRLGFPPTGRETALTKTNDLSVLVDGRERQTLNNEGGPYSVDFTRTLAVFYDGKLAARASIKTGLLARLRQAFFLRQITRLEEGEWPKKKAQGRKRSRELSKLSPSFMIAIAITTFVVLTLLVVWLGNLVGPIIDGLLHNIAPAFNLLP